MSLFTIPVELAVPKKSLVKMSSIRVALDLVIERSAKKSYWKLQFC